MARGGCERWAWRIACVLTLLASPAAWGEGDGGIEAAPASGRITFAQGSATRVPQGAESDAGAPVGVGESVAEGDRLLTGVDGRLELMLPDGTVLRLGPNSELLVAEVGFKADSATLTARLRLSVGAIWAHVTKLAQDGRFEVETEQAVAGVRGTEFRVDTSEVGHSVEVYEGRVGVGPSRPSFIGRAPAPVAGLKAAAVMSSRAAEQVVEPGKRLDVHGNGARSLGFATPLSDEFGSWARTRPAPDREKVFSQAASPRPTPAAHVVPAVAPQPTPHAAPARSPASGKPKSGSSAKSKVRRESKGSRRR